MAITPLAGWKVDPNNPNGVVQDGPASPFGTPGQAPAPVAPPAPVVAPPQPPKPITTTSSDTANQYIADNNQKMQTLRNTGVTLGQDGLARYSDQSFATAPSDAMQGEDGTWQSGGVKYALGPATTQDPELQAINDQITNMKTQFDNTSRAQIDNIKSQFDNLMKQQQDVNTRGQASLDQSLLMSGSSRYAQQSSAGQSTAMVSYGLRQLEDLNQKEQSAIIQAQAAQDAGDMKLMDMQLQVAQKARTEKQTAAKELSDKLMKANEQAKAQSQQSEQDLSIANLVGKGITDVTGIMNALNESGVKVTADQVNKTLQAIATNTGADTLEKLGGDTKDFYLLKKSGLLPTGVEDLGSYLKYINSAKQTPAQIAAANYSAMSSSLNMQQKSLSITRTQQLVESAKALEATRLVGSQITHDAGVQNFLKIQPMMDRLRAAQQDIAERGINQSNAADLLDAITQINTGGKVITEGQISLTKDSQSYADQASTLMQKISGQGGVISPKIAADATELSKKIFGLYQAEFQKRTSIYNNRLSDVAGQDLRAYSPLTDITNLPAVLDGSYQNALSGNVQDTSTQVNTMNAQDLLDNPPDEVGSNSYDPTMWNPLVTQ